MVGEVSNPVRFGYGQSQTDDRNLFLKVFGGEVLTAFDIAVKFMDKHSVRTAPAGAKSMSFPKTWKATSEYHMPGNELMGTDIDTSEIVITIDDILVAHTAIADIDEMLSHFDVRKPFADAMGHELAKVYDKNVARTIALAARTAADGPFPGGTVITDAALTNTGVANGIDWIEHIREANRKFFDLSVPETSPRYFACNANVFDAIKYAKDSNGHYLVLNRDFGGQADVARREETLNIDGVTIFKSANLPTANETSLASVYPKYRANYSTTTALMWVPEAVATARKMALTFESERDVRRQEDFLVAKQLCGHGPLRPEGAIEFKTA